MQVMLQVVGHVSLEFRGGSEEVGRVHIALVFKAVWLWEDAAVRWGNWAVCPWKCPKVAEIGGKLLL